MWWHLGSQEARCCPAAVLFTRYSIPLHTAGGVPLRVPGGPVPEVRHRNLHTVNTRGRAAPSLARLASLARVPACPRHSGEVSLCSEGRDWSGLLHPHQRQQWRDLAFSQYPRPSLHPRSAKLLTAHLLTACVSWDSELPREADIRYMGYSARWRGAGAPAGGWRCTVWAGWGVAQVPRWAGSHSTLSNTRWPQVQLVGHRGAGAVRPQPGPGGGHQPRPGQEVRRGHGHLHQAAARIRQVKQSKNKYEYLYDINQIYLA